MTLPPAVLIDWTTSQSGVGAPFGWNISNGGNTIRFDVQDSFNCGGPNNNIQSGTAFAALSAQARFNMTVSLTGIGEREDPNYENMTLNFNGTNIITSTSSGGGLGCAAGGPVVQTILVPGPYFLPKNSDNAFQLTFTTRDELYHIGCFYQCNLTFTLLDPPDIFEFYASPNPQTSGITGIPSANTVFFWNTFGAETLSINQGVGNLSSISGSTGTIDTGLQSIAGSVSPATKTYTLTAANSAGTTTAQTTVSVYNDNDPSAFTIPDQTNLEPNQSYIINVGTISSSVIDMITSVTGLNGATVSKNNTTSWNTKMTIDPNNSVQVRFFSLGFNQSPEGLTNSTTYGVTIGTQTAYFTATTRAPDVNETFNLPDEVDRVPYPDIDTIDEPSEQYIVSNTLSVDDIELINPSGVEIRTNNGNAQIRKKITGTSTWGPWQDVRSI